MKNEWIRVYPTCCTSAFCGKIDCAGCRNLPTLNEFKAWVERTGAKVTDPIWCPNVYTVTGRKEDSHEGDIQRSDGDR